MTERHTSASGEYTHPLRQTDWPSRPKERFTPCTSLAKALGRLESRDCMDAFAPEDFKEDIQSKYKETSRAVTSTIPP